MEALVRRQRLPHDGRAAADPHRRSAPARLIALLGLLAALGASLVAGTGGAPAAMAMGPLPACRYDDILTSPRRYADWPRTLVDTILMVTKTYVPPDLVPASQAGIGGGGKVRAVMIDDLAAMTQAAAAAESPIAVQSAYRDYATQKSVFDGWVKRFGYARALQLSARPGHSEHQLGLAIDFSEPGGSPFTGDFELTPQARWLKAHAWEYGFVLSYPKGAIKLVCYDFEPWHYRYVGRDVASAIHASGLTPREYLWAHFTTTIVPPPSVKPSHSALPSAAPSDSLVPSTPPLATPSATPTPTLPPTEQPTATPGPSPSLEPVSPVSAGIPVAAAVAIAALAVLVVGGTGLIVLRRGR